MTGDSREIMEALGDRTRFSIVEALSRKPMTGDELAESVQRARSTVESHLSVLLRLNLVTRRLEDRTYYYDATPLARQYAGIAARGAEATPASPATATDADADGDTANKTKADAPAVASRADPGPMMRHSGSGPASSPSPRRQPSERSGAPERALLGLHPVARHNAGRLAAVPSAT
jgi:DNA-binding transcriptional ArsR family regulator